MEKIRVYTSNQMNTEFRGIGGHYVGLTEKELTFGLYGCPEYRGHSTTIPLPEKFQNVVVHAIIGIITDYVENNFPCSKIKFIPELNPLEKGEAGIQSDKYWITIVGDYVHVANRVYDTGNPRWFAWDFERNRMSMPEIIEILQNPEKGIRSLTLSQRSG